MYLRSVKRYLRMHLRTGKRNLRIYLRTVKRYLHMHLRTGKRNLRMHLPYVCIYVQLTYPIFLQRTLS